MGWSDSWLPRFRFKPGSVGVAIEAGNVFIAPLDEVPPLTPRATKVVSSRFPTARFRLSLKSGIQETILWL